MRKRLKKNKYYSELLEAADLSDLIDGEDETEEADAYDASLPDEGAEYDAAPAETEEEDGEDPMTRTVRAVLMLIVFFTLAELLIVLFFIGGEDFTFGSLKLSCALGLIAGGCAAAVFFLLMKRQVETVTAMPSQSAKNRLKLGSILRILAVAAMTVLFAFTKVIHPLAFLIGVLNLKFAALAAPLLDKFLKKG